MNAVWKVIGVISPRNRGITPPPDDEERCIREEYMRVKDTSEAKLCEHTLRRYDLYSVTNLVKLNRLYQAGGFGKAFVDQIIINTDVTLREMLE